MSPLAQALLRELADDPAAMRELASALAPYLPQPAPAEQDRWLSTREAAEYLGVSPNALHKLTAARSIPAEQDCPGGKLHFKRSELDRWRRSGGAATAPTPLPLRSHPAA